VTSAMRRLMLGLGLAAVIVFVGACTGTSRSAATTTPTKPHAAPFTIRELAAPMAWGSGDNLLRPATTSDRPEVTAAAAHAAAQRHEGPGSSAHPEMILGLYTSPDGRSGGYQDTLVWLAWYRHVSFTVTSPPSASGQSQSTRTIGDGFTLVDATSGSVISAGSVAPPLP
jgi:hypothetical protein